MLLQGFVEYQNPEKKVIFSWPNNRGLIQLMSLGNEIVVGMLDHFRFQ